MIYLLNNNKLPWSDFVKTFKNQNYRFSDYLRERLNIKYTKEVIMMCPKELRKITKYVLSMKFNEEPPYNEIIDLLKK